MNLVGILPGPPLQAVIENKKKKTTFYVTAGETIGEMSVLSVTPDRVRIGCGEETLDLTL